VDIGNKGGNNGKDTPGGIAIETLLNIRTVSALNMERSRYDDYVMAIKKKEDFSLWSSVKVGSISGFSFLVQQCVTALEFGWGGWLLIHYPGHFTFQNFLISAFSLLFALFALGTSSIGAVEKKEMQAAAQRIFELVNRKSTIDSLSSEGVERN
jgi:ATP-binding cassette subfamily B (MDR/TAP) protein 1